MEIISKGDFQEKTGNGIVVLDFFASWCGPCRMMAPILEEVQEKMQGKANIYKIDVDEDEELAREFGIMSIPTIFILVNGEIKFKHVGLIMQDELIEQIERLL